MNFVSYNCDAEMAERFKAHDWKSCYGRPYKGSNPFLRAKSVKFNIFDIVLSPDSVFWNTPNTINRGIFRYFLGIFWV